MKERSLLKRLVTSFGPGFISGAADDDPTAVATYTQTGAQFGYSQLWTQPWSLPFMIAIQEMCGRIGLVTGHGLSGVIKRNYSRTILYGAVALLLIANIINIGADLGAMAAGVQLFLPLPFIVLLLAVSVGPLIVEIIVPYPTYARFLKFLTLFLLAYIATAVIVNADWSKALNSAVLPHFEWSKEYLFNIAAILGTTISPYLFFWQSDEEVEEEIAHRKIRALGKGRPHIDSEDVRELRWSTTVGMFFSQAITFFIIITAAATLGAHGLHVNSAADAARALEPLAGNFASILFALGLLGTGLLAVPVLAGSAAYAVSEAFGWRAGLGRSFRQAPGFYGIIILATMLGLAINMSAIDPMRMLYYAAAVNAVLAPPLMVVMLLIGNDRGIMGKMSNGPLSNVFGIIMTAVMSVVSLATIGSVAGLF